MSCITYFFNAQPPFDERDRFMSNGTRWPRALDSGLTVQAEVLRMNTRRAPTQPLTQKLLGVIARAYEDWNDEVTLPWLVRYNILFPEIIERELTLARRERRIRDAFRKLRRGRYVKIKKIRSKMLISLTHKGTGAVLLGKIKNGGARTDSKVLLVSFDIPERARDLRYRFTRTLRTVGLRRLQKSLWVTDKDVVSPLRQYLDGLNKKSWIRLFEAREIPPK